LFFLKKERDSSRGTGEKKKGLMPRQWSFTTRRDAFQNQAVLEGKEPHSKGKGRLCERAEVSTLGPDRRGGAASEGGGEKQNSKSRVATTENKGGFGVERLAKVWKKKGIGEPGQRQASTKRERSCLGLERGGNFSRNVEGRWGSRQCRENR